MTYLRRFITIGCLMTVSLPLSGCLFGGEDTEGSLAYLWKREKFKPRAAREAIFTGTPGVGDDDSYSEGFKQGCQNITAAIGQGSFRLQSIDIDGFRLTSDPWYLRGYADASSDCTFMLDWDTH